MPLIFCDFETSSEVDLMKANASVYSNHPSTEILCGVFIYENGHETVITDFDLFGGDEELLNWLKNPEYIFVAHNAIFEQLMWQNILVKRYCYPELPPNRWKDTMAKLHAHSLPGSLEKGAEALNLLQKKDMGGKMLMRKMCKPNGPRDEQSMDSLIAYCRQDVLTTIAIDKALPDLSPYEQKVWELDQEINLRGVQIDIELVLKLIALLEVEKNVLLTEFESITGLGSSSQVGKFKDWLNAHGYNLESVDAKSIAVLQQGSLSPSVQRALEIRSILSKSSTAKYSKIIQQIDTDGRIRENLVYHGCGTGRWSAKGVQFQNLPRPKKGINIEQSIKDVDHADILWPSSVSHTASSLVRSVLIPKKGKVFVGGDYAGIEARITPWIAGQKETLEIFRQGKDIYCEEATTTFNRIITKVDELERQVGKCQVLGLGFGGGIAAEYKMCQIYGVDLNPLKDIILPTATSSEMSSAEFCATAYIREAKKSGVDHLEFGVAIVADILKQRWRAKNKRIVEFWANVEQEAIDAVHGIPLRDNYSNLSFTVVGDFLYLTLPSGRNLAYYKPQVKVMKNKWGIEKETFLFLGVHPTTKQLIQESMYGGKWTENIVQGIARDIMVNGMFNVKDYGSDIVLTIHDELLLDVEENVDMEKVESCFISPPKWALDLPLDASIWKGTRFKK